ncbi:TonB-dependent receptor [Edaphobacter albus]|uniref:TonB-dependent receptor n=1 Tax=Edaphobacter sp. 4G125 TaxID=2763071 RepID=UPI00164717E4|nr:TonB-dependent receptor [Edaphobacter sp. 4G125]QNI36034.1 TonB-dependent receptor [Edaphobacter sp. 4G125]
MRRLAYYLIFLWLFQSQAAHATIFGQIQGIVHDPQHRPVSGAKITIHAVHSDFAVSGQTDQEGSFHLTAIPLGEYVITVSQTGFSTLEQTITLASNTSPLLHFELQVGSVKQSVTVSTQSGTANVDSVTPTTLVGRIDIARTPGADRTNSLQMITNFVPGAYITHDMLHMRGGHQVSWQIDGVQIPNTNIASNLGAQIDPKDIDYLEVQRGSYNSDVGDRTYGVFNVVPRTGFERNNEGEIVLSLGSFFQTNDQINFGSHTEKFAYYTSVNGNRSDYGLSPPIAKAYHNAANGYGGFASFIYNRTPQDQLRLITQLRTDYYQIPYDPDPDSAENQQYDSSGLRDGQHETDGIVAFTWAHTFSASTLLQASPFYHYNRANYQPNINDLPVATTSDRVSSYAGVQASITTIIAGNTLQAGFYSFGQHDSYAYGSIFNDGSYPNFKLNDSATGGVFEEFVSDNYKVTSWLTLIAGLRQSHFSGTFTEDATNPRVGAALQVPKLHWVFRGFYGRFYQPPPLLTASGPIVNYANSQNTTFLPLHGERDEEHQFGVQIPLRGWLLDADTFKTRANNFLDHSNVGESSIYYPITIDGALIRGWELTLRSPRLWHGGQAHLAYSNQIGEQRGAIAGGLVCYPIASRDCAADFTYSPLDHDQRNTLNVGYSTSLPFRAFASTNVYYGSGFHNGSPNEQYPDEYLSQHTTLDLAIGKSIGERTIISVNALNVGNRRVLLDNSLTFGGFHYNDPREIYGEIRYRFHY